MNLLLIHFNLILFITIDGEYPPGIQYIIILIFPVVRAQHCNFATLLS